MMMLWVCLLAAQAAGGPAPTIEAIAASGRCATLAESPSQRVSPRPAIAPGPAPLLSFRYFEGRTRHRFGNFDLVLDDAGH